MHLLEIPFQMQNLFLAGIVKSSHKNWFYNTKCDGIFKILDGNIKSITVHLNHFTISFE